MTRGRRRPKDITHYFEKTDALIWVVDTTDRLRLEECRHELHALLLEEVRLPPVVLRRHRVLAPDAMLIRATETCWSLAPDLREQDGRRRMHGGRGNPGGA